MSREYFKCELGEYEYKYEYLDFQKGEYLRVQVKRPRVWVRVRHPWSVLPYRKSIHFYTSNLARKKIEKEYLVSIYLFYFIQNVFNNKHAS